MDPSVENYRTFFGVFRNFLDDLQDEMRLQRGQSARRTFVAQDGTIVIGTDDFKAEDVDEPQTS